MLKKVNLLFNCPFVGVYLISIYTTAQTGTPNKILNIQIQHNLKLKWDVIYTFSHGYCTKGNTIDQ